MSDWMDQVIAVSDTRKPFNEKAEFSKPVASRSENKRTSESMEKSANVKASRGAPKKRIKREEDKRIDAQQTREKNVASKSLSKGGLLKNNLESLSTNSSYSDSQDRSNGPASSSLSNDSSLLEGGMTVRQVRFTKRQNSEESDLSATKTIRATTL
jgi:hypothetical protein